MICDGAWRALTWDHGLAHLIMAMDDSRKSSRYPIRYLPICGKKGVSQRTMPPMARAGALLCAECIAARPEMEALQ